MIVMLEFLTKATPPPCVADNNAESGIICTMEYVCQGTLDSVSHVKLWERGHVKRPNEQQSLESEHETDHRFSDAEDPYIN